MVGLRRERYQQVLCKSCGEALFVLPINVYPEPPPEKPRATEIAGGPKPPPLPKEPTAGSGAAGTDDLLADLEQESRFREKQKILGDDSPVPPLPRKLTRAERKELARQKKANEKRQRQENPLTAREPFGRKLRRVFSPFRVVVVSIVGLVVATIAWQVHQRNLDSARLTFENGRKNANAALGAGDFEKAETLFASAADAANLVGRDDVGANRVRRLAIETEVLNSLSEGSLFQAVQRASTSRGSVAAQRVVDLLGGDYIVLATRVFPSRRTEDGQRFLVEVPLFLNGTFVDAEVTGGEFERLKLDKDGTEAVFSAKVQSAQFGQDAGKDFLMLKFEPDSVRLWADKRTLAAVGVEVDESTLEILASQAELFGIK